MTAEEAIEILNNTAWLGTDNGIKVYPAIRAAVEALKKQVPVKPSCISVDWFQCPSCRNRFGYNIRNVAMLYKYCPSCGQRIDWEGVK